MKRRSCVTVICLLVGLSACREPNAPMPSSAPLEVAAPQAEVQPAAASTVDLQGMYPAGTTFVSGKLCNIEYLGDLAFGSEPLSLDSSKSLRGWLGDEKGDVPRAVALRFIDDQDKVLAQLPVSLGIAREDVAAAFPGTSGLANGGFAITLTPDSLPTGTWRIHLVYTVGESSDTRAVSCDNGRRVTVVAAR